MNNFLIVFLYYNLQFIFDYYSKISHIDFVNSFNSKINIEFFIYFQLYSFITFILQNYEKIINKKYLEKYVHIKTYNLIQKDIKDMSIIWIETQSQSILQDLFNKTAQLFYNKYFTLLELYGACIRVITNIYILYTIYDKFLYIIIPYLLIYYYLYHYVILINREKTKKENIIINKFNILQKNLCLVYYNSFIGNYINDYFISFINYYNEGFLLTLLNTIRDIIYHGTLQLGQKILFCILFYIYLYNNDKSNLFLLSIYQTTITLVYQFEYIFHNYYGYITANDNMTLYNNFLKDFDKYKKKHTSIKYTLKAKFNYNISINTDISYNINRSILNYNINFFISNIDRYILYGNTGTGKSTFAKLIAGHFPNYHLPISEQILYISQNNYINYQYRTLANIICQTDLNINSISNYYIMNQIFDNIINIDDIKNSFINSNDFLEEELTHTNFSGGQEKRIYLIMWLYHLINNINKYKIFILYEPDKGLDYETFYTIIDNIFKYKLFNNICIIIITHNYKIIENLTEKKIELLNNNNNITCIIK